MGLMGIDGRLFEVDGDGGAAHCLAAAGDIVQAEERRTLCPPLHERGVLQNGNNEVLGSMNRYIIRVTHSLDYSDCSTDTLTR